MPAPDPYIPAYTIKSAIRRYNKAAVLLDAALPQFRQTLIGESR